MSFDNRNGKVHQKWRVVYVDEYKEPTKGQLNKDFGVYVQRDFYIVSQLSSNRYLDIINTRQLVIKTPNGRSSQKWWFDQRTKTIKSKWRGESFDIKSSGKTNDIQVWGTNSNWW
jgi:hypothetical protein